jgi:cytochrome c biogenesis protein CcmG, thiol:disulfide interchange protein DsbE
MSPRKTLLLALGSILVIVFSGWITERRRVMSAGDTVDGQLSVQSIGQPAPDFTLQAVDGRRVRLSDYRGRTVIVAFWASWCGPCLFEMPTLVDFYRQQKGNVALLAVSMDDTEDDAKAYAGHNHLPFPVLFDGKQRVAGAYAVEGIPALFVVDPGGRVTAQHEGLIPSLNTVLAADVEAGQRQPQPQAQNGK